MPTDVFIDHTSFPYIIDLIISHADLDGMLKWRRTSYSLRARVDRILFSHVTLDPHRPWSDDQDHVISLGPGSTSHSPGVHAHKSLPFAPEAVQIIDVRHKPDGKFSDYGLDRLTSVHTIRRKALIVALIGTNQVPSARTAVDFFDIHNIPNYIRRRRADKTNIWLPVRLKRYCLHVEWYQDVARELGTIVDFKSTRNIREWVLILHPTSFGGDAHFYPSYPPFLGSIITHMVKVLDRKGSITIVGAEEVNPAQFGGGSTDSSTDLLRATVMHHLHTEFPQGPKRTHADSHTTFTTLPDWLASLGDLKDIEGQWIDGPRLVICRDCEMSVSH